MSPAGIRLTEGEAWRRAREVILEEEPWATLTLYGQKIVTCRYCGMVNVWRPQETPVIPADLLDVPGHEAGCLYVLARDWREGEAEGDGEE